MSMRRRHCGAGPGFQGEPQEDQTQTGISWEGSTGSGMKAFAHPASTWATRPEGWAFQGHTPGRTRLGAVGSHV